MANEIKINTSQPVNNPYLTETMKTLGINEDINSITARMHDPATGLSIRRRRASLFSSHAEAFAGSEFVQWILTTQLLQTEAGAVALGAHFVELGVINPLTHLDRVFKNSSDLYRLQSDEESRVLNARHVFIGKARSALIVAASLQQQILSMYGKFLNAEGTFVDYVSLGASEEYAAYVAATGELQAVDLTPLVENHEEKVVFFLNLYNALVVHANVEIGPATSALSRSKWYRTVSYNIGGSIFSLDDIEHGILRGNQKHLGNVPFSPEDPRLPLAVKKLDPRVHFALVCGAKSCPPIRLYKVQNLERGLTLAAQNFLSSETSIDLASSTITLSKLLDWYGKDFGASKEEMLRWVAQFLEEGMQLQLRKLLDSGTYNVKFKAYDWSLNGSAKS